jgi:hypothetical protein
MPTTSSGLKSAQLLTFNVIGLVALPCFFSGDTGVAHSTRQLPALISHVLPAWQDPKDDTISISIVGDMMVGSSYPSRAMLPPEQEGSIAREG